MSANLMENKYFAVLIKKDFFLNLLLNILVAEGGCIIQKQCHTHMKMITVML